VGGILGWWIALRAVHIFDVVVTPLGKPSWFDFSMDYRALTYLLAISIATGVIFGLAPALRLSMLDANTSLKESGHGISIGVRRKRLSGLLVTAEMALAMVLLTGAGLMIRSFLNAFRAPLGVNTTNVLTMFVNLPEAQYPQPNDQVAFNDRLGARLKSLPGVESLALASAPPTGRSLSFPYELEGVPSDAQRRPSLSTVIIGPDYFRVLGVGVLRGRIFAETDDASEAPVVIVNQRFADMFLSGEDPLGKRFRLYVGGQPQPWLTVVGLVPNIVQNDISSREIDPLLYLPYRQKPLAAMTILARAQVPPATLEPAFRREMQALDPDLPYNLVTLQERLERNYWFYRVFGTLFAIFAGIALLLAALGLYALMASSVNQRTREIGVRMALGATSRKVLQLAFRDGMRQLAVGVVLGLVVAFGVMRGLAAVLVQVSPADPATFVIASLILVSVAVLGCYIPARRATKVDPMVALRYE
jgi:putative ABC transport system permease protein